MDPKLAMPAPKLQGWDAEGPRHISCPYLPPSVVRATMTLGSIRALQAGENGAHSKGRMVALI